MRVRRTSPAPVAAPRILGIDPSLTSTGYAYFRDGELYTGSIQCKDMNGPARINVLRVQMAKVIEAAQPDIVVYEGYAVGGHKNFSTQLEQAELGGVFKTLLWENGIDVMLVTPTQLKIFIAGHGHAEKYPGEKKPKKGKAVKKVPNMRDAINETFGYLLMQPDEADAFGLLMCGELRFGNSGDLQNLRRLSRMKSLGDCPIIKGRRNRLKLISNKP